MRILTQIIRVLVGVLFIFSGLVKANDPSGLSYKMQEFFDLWGWSTLNGITLALSILMIAFEIIAGIALLIGWRTKLISWLLLLLIIFFTFLTGYAYLSGKFSNCGCFGDCIPITSKTSFLKDVALLIMIIFLFIQQKYIRPVFSKGITTLILLLGVLFSFASQWYCLKYLPVVDCLPFKKGNYIPDKMKIPANAIPDSTVITFVYEKGGKKVEFTAEDFPDDFDESTYKFVNRYDKIIRPGFNNIPEIRGFDFSDANGNNITDKILTDDNVLLLFSEDVSTPVKDWQHSFTPLYKLAQDKNLPVYLITSVSKPMREQIANTPFKNIPVLDGDRVMIRTASRAANPTIYLLQKGVVAGKWSFKNFTKAAKVVDALPAAPVQPSMPLTTIDTTVIN